MSILTVKKLCKTYPAFQLRDVSFSLEKGKITGFVGRNGAGKSTTFKSMFDFVHPDSGTIEFFDQTFAAHEREIKQRVGYVAGGIDYYEKKKIRIITDVTKAFYENWDDTAYRSYMQRFALDEEKTPAELSAGMRVKYALTLALSHHAELLVLDEPTSGLDPVSRDEILDIFLDLCEEGVTILFSTHITSDLEKCADNIVYIKSGTIIAQSELKAFVESYELVTWRDDKQIQQIKERLIGRKRIKDGYSALIRSEDVCERGKEQKPETQGAMPHMQTEEPYSDEYPIYAAADLESIMVHIEKEEVSWEN